MKARKNHDENSIAEILYQNKIAVDKETFANTNCYGFIDWLVSSAEENKLRLRVSCPTETETLLFDFAGPASYQAALRFCATAWNLIMLETIEKGVVYVALMERKED